MGGQMENSQQFNELRRKAPKEVSIVVPVYNEEKVINCFYERTMNVMKNTKSSYEIVFVDDGSTDGSLEIIKNLKDKDGDLGYVSFSRNFGHMAALFAGLEKSTGAAVISLDVDLQHPPELIPELLKEWRQGFQIVCAVNNNTKAIGFAKRWTSSMFYRLIARISDIKIPLGSSDFRLLDRQVVDEILKMNEKRKFLRGIVEWIGFKKSYVPYSVAQRYTGESKYNYKKMINFALDAIFAFSLTPIRLSFLLGAVVSTISFLYGMFTIVTVLCDIRWYRNQPAIPGWLSIMVAILFLGGIQLMAMGILGEYVGRIYEESKNRPLYVIKESSTS
jgi:dolichol-phosphate mannosyltransferase